MMPERLKHIKVGSAFRLTEDGKVIYIKTDYSESNGNHRYIAAVDFQWKVDFFDERQEVFPVPGTFFNVIEVE